jgi:release factor glutamine methyltransferase
MTAREALVAAVARLEAAGIEGAARDARVLLAHALGVGPDRLTLHLPEALCKPAQPASRWRRSPGSACSGACRSG